MQSLLFSSWSSHCNTTHKWATWMLLQDFFLAANSLGSFSSTRYWVDLYSSSSFIISFSTLMFWDAALNSGNMVMSRVTTVTSRDHITRFPRDTAWHFMYLPSITVSVSWPNTVNKTQRLTRQIQTWSDLSLDQWPTRQPCHPISAG